MPYGDAECARFLPSLPSLLPRLRLPPAAASSFPAPLRPVPQRQIPMPMSLRGRSRARRSRPRRAMDLKPATAGHQATGHHRDTVARLTTDKATGLRLHSAVHRHPRPTAILKTTALKSMAARRTLRRSTAGAPRRAGRPCKATAASRSSKAATPRPMAVSGSKPARTGSRRSTKERLREFCRPQPTSAQTSHELQLVTVR